MRRKFTENEDVFLREHYGKCNVESIASKLGRSLSSVYQRASKLGLVSRRNCATDAQIVKALTEYHPQGWSDAEIASHLQEQLGFPVNRHRVGEIRRRDGLAANVGSEHMRKRVSARTREQLDASGFGSLAELRNSRFSEFKRSLGWPETLSVRAVQAADLLKRHGAMTRHQLCLAMGVDPIPRTAPKSNAKGGTVLAELAREGIVGRLRKVVPKNLHNRSRNRTDLYFITPEWMNRNDSRIPQRTQAQ